MFCSNVSLKFNIYSFATYIVIMRAPVLLKSHRLGYRCTLSGNAILYRMLLYFYIDGASRSRGNSHRLKVARITALVLCMETEKECPCRAKNGNLRNIPCNQMTTQILRRRRWNIRTPTKIPHRKTFVVFLMVKD